MTPQQTKKAAKTKRVPPKVKRNTRSHQTRTSPQKSPSQTTYIKQEEIEETLLPTPRHTTHAHLAPTQKPSSTTSKVKKTAAYPKTPLNTTHPLSMPIVRNMIRRAEFREYVALGITPLEGKRRGTVQEPQSTTNLLDDEDLDEFLAKTWQDCRNDQESEGLRWLRRQLWGEGKWALRTEHEEDVLFVASALGEEEWRALWA
ncbi:hypothetical protein COCMIDRAFT_6680 [Bipolaris oryzae ATCC 44560]|uniref:Uncharacterized protein n=1 Tax=Bipolaris oryzae ATCC 44560 TaxID=930090 RepID=W6ZJY6_COCMI|nr:uncharacterized protein COCMIDRAFT_6680 [Bipolaris oryzae ATCC 44560]EUC43901.1 hypothetical protein COCMIDRAFT_6680 [Bipolaris oryzae ATCC 44560]